MFIGLFKKNFIYRMTDTSSTTPTPTIPTPTDVTATNITTATSDIIPTTETKTTGISDDEKIKLKKQILDSGAVFFSDPNNPKKRKYAGHGELGITTILPANKILRNPFSKATNELEDFDIEKTDQGIMIHRKNTDKELQINFRAVKEAIHKDKSKSFTIKITDEKYPDQYIEYTNNPNGSKSVKIDGANMKINFDDPSVNRKRDRIKGVFIEKEYVESPNAYIGEDGKIVIECDAKQVTNIQEIYGDMKINGMKVKEIIENKQLKIRDKSIGGISAGVRKEVTEVAKILESTILSETASTTPASTPITDTRSRSTTVTT